MSILAQTDTVTVMAKVGRNDPCPCGSGRKFKKCCIGLRIVDQRREKTSIDQAELLREHRRVMEDFERRKRDHATTYGYVRPVISTIVGDTRFVAVGSTVHWSKTWKTVPDFLSEYIKRTLGEEWGTAEIRKPLADRHPILQWYDSLCRLQERNKASLNSAGLYTGVKDGPTAAYYQLAYDLYVLADHQKLQERIIERLKRSDQFQGARYELSAATHCIRAGFDLEHEDETDRSTKHPEFVAQHIATGQKIAVEAKSRHRPGVLGQPGEMQEEPKAAVRRILKRALEKSPPHPYAVFVDLNLPPTEVSDIREVPWIQELQRELKDAPPEGHPYNVLMFTNYPHHYGAEAAPNPGPGYVTVLSLKPRMPVQHPKALTALCEAAETYGRVPNWFEE
jgi:SEC-C motif-containing protein